MEADYIVGALVGMVLGLVLGVLFTLRLCGESLL